MKIPLSWLKEFLPLNQSAKKIAETLTLLGLEVDAINSSGSNFDGVYVAEVQSVVPHSNAEHLQIAQVTDGSETLQVVCGAPNCRPGIRTALAKIGAVLKDEEGKDFKIKKGKIRGIESFGMLCAHEELHLSEKDYGIKDGIMELPSDIPLGTPLKDLFEDVVFDISLTPNLNYCSSVSGVARELSTVVLAPLSIPPINVNDHSSNEIAGLIEVSIENPQKCPRYTCRLIKGISQHDSPDWLKARLEQCGMRSINLIVDVTNYVLLEYGHPLHAFDYDQLEGNRIIVRDAHPDETIITLDGIQRHLTPDNLVICDAKKPIAIAGVMGGKNSEVSEKTRDVLLEAAYFSPAHIRRTSKQTGLITESSKRFERGVDPLGLIRALDRAALLLEQLGKGIIVSGCLDITFETFTPKTIECRWERINNLLGTTLGLNEIETIFYKLGFKTQTKDALIYVTVPTYRNDISQEIDLIEEVARIYGYDHIKKRPVAYRASAVGHTPSFLFEKEIRQIMISLGLQEFLTCDLISPEQAAWIAPDSFPSRSLVKLLNPSSVDQSIMRPSLLPGLLQVVRNNAKHQWHHIAGFEVGRVHFKIKDSFVEPSVLSIVLSGKRLPFYWDRQSIDVDFFDLKGVIENLFDALHIKRLEFKKTHYSNFHSGRQAGIFLDNREIGIMGEIHPQTAHQADLKERVYFAEINIADLMKSKEAIVRLATLPEFPASQRDWTVTLHENTPLGTVLQLARAFGSQLLEDVELINIYRNEEKLGTEWKNATFHFVYRDPKKTVSMETVDKEHQRILNLIHAKLNESIKT